MGTHITQARRSGGGGKSSDHTRVAKTNQPVPVNADIATENYAPT
jgi:hypothetical protein